jgi:hypothetical protein
MSYIPLITVAKEATLDLVKIETDLLPDGGALTSLAQDLTVAKDATVAKSSNLTTAQNDITTIKNVINLLPN